MLHFNEKINKLKAQGHKDTVELEKLAYIPDFIHVLDITEDADGKYNKQLELQLELGFPIKLKK